MGKDRIALDNRDQSRLLVLNELLRGGVTAEYAAAALHISRRHLRRLVAAYVREGAKALAHGNRGRTPPNRISEETRIQVVTLAQTRYADVNDTHLAELLARDIGIDLSRSTVRRLLRQAGRRSPQTRRSPKHRQRRERMPRPGMLLQMDASIHDWLQGRGSRLTLIGCIDDATGTVPAAFFQQAEDTRGYFELLHQVARTQGLPEAVYVDRSSVFAKVTDATLSVEEQLQGIRHRPTQCARLLQRLSVSLIFALSPQAKGRIERLWRTFQDRLVVELRLAEASTMDQANTLLARFIPDFNTRFRVPPADTTTAYRPAPPNLDDLFTLRYTATVAPDHTIRCNGRRLQIVPASGERGYVRCRIELWEHLHGDLSLHHGDQTLSWREAPPDAGALRRAPSPAPEVNVARSEVAAAAAQAPAAWKPAKDHPWRKAAQRGWQKKMARTFSVDS